MNNEYDVKQYTESQLFNILNVNNPSDRELEAKIISMIRKYRNFENPDGDKLAKFFEDIYDYFFEPEDETEGFSTMEETSDDSNAPANSESSTTLNQNVEANNLQLTRPLEYSKDSLNPLLKQTIKRIISIDSQYRDNKSTTSTTSYNFNLSEPIKDVVSLSLYSVQIPYTWQTINSDFGGNFFYIKGNSPGINNGNHNYKISIPPGNYTPTGLETAVNVGISNASKYYADVSFGNTRIIYNNGNPSDSGTGKNELDINITKVYDAGNYKLKFQNWSSPLNNDPTQAPSSVRFKTIAGYLGFNNMEYTCSSISSILNGRIPLSSNPAASQSIIINANAKWNFNIIPYKGTGYTDYGTVFYAPINIDLSNQITGDYSTRNFVTALNNILTSNRNLDSVFSGCKWIDISNADQFGNQSSYIQIDCKVINTLYPGVQNLKLAAVFPVDANSIFCDFTGYTSSVFHMYPTKNDASGNFVLEFNELISEGPTLISNYAASGDGIFLECTASGYNNPYNNFWINIPDGVYNLNNYVTSFSRNIDSNLISSTSTNNNVSSNSSINLSVGSDGYVTINTTINNSYPTNNFRIRASGKFNTIFGIPTTASTIKSTYENPSYSFLANNSVSLDSANDLIWVTSASGLTTNIVFNIVPFNAATATFSDGARILQQVIAGYVDPITKTYPFSQSTVDYNYATNRYILSFNMNFYLTHQNYKMKFYSNSTPINNLWDVLDFSYNTGNYSTSSPNYYDLSRNSVIISTSTVKQNTMTIYDGSNDRFTISVNDISGQRQIDGLTTSSRNYDVNIIIPSVQNGSKLYSVNDLILTINEQLTANPITNGSSISQILINGNNYIKFNFILSKKFFSSDYRLVFYDPYSYMQIISSSSINGLNTMQNVTWDSTLGWILGYRNLIEYNMSEYSGITYPSIGLSNTERPSIFYYSDISNTFVIYSDTSVSTNLYNYFLISLDDYVQNHLNDGLITITSQEISNDPGAFNYITDPATNQRIAIPADYGSPGITYTQQQLESFNQKVKSQLVAKKSYSSGPFVQDIFGLIPVKTAGLPIGSTYVEFGGSLQLQQRLYFGPVNIHRMSIKLLTDRGNIVDLNGANWSFSLVCEQLYKNGIS